MTGNKTNKLLLISLINVLLLSVGHACNNHLLLWGALAIFLASAIFSQKGNFLPLMLFYLPWSPVLKTTPNSFTFFTLVVAAVFPIILYDGVKKDLIKYVIFILFFAVYTLLVKFLNGLPIHMSYLFFILMLVFIPIYVNKYKDNISFESCAVFMTAGVLSACIAAEILMIYPQMSQYIEVYKWEQVGLTRLSGFYGDSNYYSAQILVSIAAILLLQRNSKSMMLLIWQIFMIILLFYFGMLSVSKMFIICIVIITSLWIISFLVDNRTAFHKVGLVLLIFITADIIFTSKLFLEQINLYILRFSMVEDVSSLTTGRIELFKIYLYYLLSHFDKLFFGIGLSQNQLKAMLDTNDVHNSIMEIIYQIGIIGFIFMTYWWKCIYKDIVKDNKRMNCSEWLYLILIAVSVFFPWMALDMMFFDEFFYFTLLFIFAKKYIKQNNRAIDIGR